MFLERLNQLLREDNPINKIGEKTFDNKPIEDLIVSMGSEVEEVPDFVEVIKIKNLTKDQKDDTIEDSDKLEIKALKKLIEKYKSEK